MTARFKRARSNKWRKSVLLVIACLHQGGTEMQTLNTARVLVELGYEVGVICLFEWDASIREAFETGGVTVHCLELPSLRNFPHILGRVCLQIRAIAPSFVHVQYIAPGLLSVIAARLACAPRVLVTVHQEGARCSWFEHLLFRIATRLSHMTIFVSREAEASWLQPRRINRWLPQPGLRTVIHNCVDFTPVARPHCSSERDVWTIGYVGRIRQEKGLDILLRALSLLKPMQKEVRIVVAGDGPQRAECQNLAFRLGLSSRIEWLGLVNSDKLPELYCQFDVLVVPSRSEGFGLVAAEGMMYGVPVVAARVGGLKEIIDDGITGLLFVPEDERDLAHKLETLAADDVLADQLGAAGQKLASQSFSRDAYSASLHRVYAAFGV